MPSSRLYCSVESFSWPETARVPFDVIRSVADAPVSCRSATRSGAAERSSRNVSVGPMGVVLPAASTTLAATRYVPSAPTPSGTKRRASVITAVRKSYPLKQYSTRCPAVNGRLMESVVSDVMRSFALRPVSRASESEGPTAYTRRGSMASMESESGSRDVTWVRPLSCRMAPLHRPPTKRGSSSNGSAFEVSGTMFAWRAPPSLPRRHAGAGSQSPQVVFRG